MTRKIFQETLISLSLANLLFAASWREFLYLKTYDYHIKTGPGTLEYFGVIFCVILTAALFFSSFRLFRHFYREKAELLISLSFIFLFLTALNIFRLQFPFSEKTVLIAYIFQITFLFIIALTFTKWRGVIVNTIKTFTLLLSPFILVTFSQAFAGIVKSATEINDEVSISDQLKTIQPDTKSGIKNRVVWIIFDEFDYRIPFELKPIEMPEFERLKNESLMATNATSPAYNTLESIPSLLTGKEVLKSNPKGQAELILNFSDGNVGKFSEMPNIFSQVKNLDGNTALIGFYHPYCLVVGHLLSVCKWEGDKFYRRKSLFPAMLHNIESFAASFSLIFSANSLDLKNQFFISSEEVQWKAMDMVEMHFKRLEEIKNIVSNPHIDFVFIHLPLPHPPAKYNRFTKEFQEQDQDYINNLALTDLVLGEIRKSMENADQWDNSSVIISTDHQLRVNHWKDSHISFTDFDRKLTGEIEDARIPFFVKLKNQKNPITYEKPFNTLITHDLILDIMNGEITSPDEAQKLLDNTGN